MIINFVHRFKKMLKTIFLFISLIAASSAVIDDRGMILSMHNIERQLVNVSDLSWDEDLAVGAEEYAMTCPSGHSDVPHENLFWSRPSFTTQQGIQAWIDEKNPGSTVVGHYLQMINPKNIRVGCAHAACYGDWTTFVCRYGRVDKDKRKTKRKRRRRKRRRKNGL